MSENLDLPPSYSSIMKMSYTQAQTKLKLKDCKLGMFASTNNILSSNNNDSSSENIGLNSYFSVKDDYKILRLALKRRSKNTLMNLFCIRSHEERDKLYSYYNRKNRNNLEYDIKDTFGRISPFTMIILGRVQPLHEYFARIMHKMTEDYLWLMEILFILPNDLRYDLQIYFKSRKL